MAAATHRSGSASAAFREYAEAILVAVLLALFAKAFVFEAFEIPSASMEDSLLVGDHVVVNKFIYGPHRGPWAALLPYRGVARGDVFVFRYPLEPERDFIKRAVALPGDSVEIVRGGLVVNGRAPEEPYVLHRGGLADDGDPRVRFGPYTVPAASSFALGDNRDDSKDSRFWGPVPDSHLRGRALFVYWSYDAGGAAARTFAGRGAGLRRFLDTALHFWSRTRWERTLRAVR